MARLYGAKGKKESGIILLANDGCFCYLSIRRRTLESDGRKQTTDGMGARKMKLKDESYTYGNGSNAFERVLCILEHSKVNSWRTSTLPLVDYWRPGDCRKGFSLLQESFEGLDLGKSKKIFEFATSLRDAATSAGKSGPGKTGRGKASMTDLMLLTKQWRIAIEAKWTECEKSYPTVSDWKAEKSDGDGSNENRKRVLETWIGCIEAAGCLAPDARKRIDGVPYQFLHRVASACCGTTSNKDPRPGVVYQLFYDNETEEAMKKFTDNLQRWKKQLCNESIRLVILSVRVSLEDKWKESVDPPTNLFTQMKQDSVFKFSDESIVAL